MKTIAVIPARGGSKGIKLKNIREICGKPLIYYQLKNALDSKLVNKVVLASDSDEILIMAKSLFGDKIDLVKRPPEISTDDSKTEDTLLFVLDRIEGSFDFIATLEPTNLLNRPEHIDTCINMLSVTNIDAVCCAVYDYSFQLLGRDNIQQVLSRPMKKDIYPRTKERGNCWVTKVEALRQYRNRLGSCFDHIIIPEEDSYHLDSETDWIIIESLMRHRLLENQENYFTPANIRTKKDLYDLRYWKEVIDPDGKHRDKTEEKEKRVASCKEELDYINNLSPGKVLDVGCGLGFLLSGINDKWEKHGVEISEFGANYAKRYGKVLCGVLQAAEYGSDSFDVVLIYHVIEHMKNPVSELKEIKRILKPGGKLIVGTPDFDCGLAKRFGYNFRLLKDTTHISLFDTFKLYRLLTDLFFDIEKVSYPFFDTEYFTKENLLRLFDTSKISPPFYGNFVTFYAHKK